jgi:hypothetical protein
VHEAGLGDGLGVIRQCQGDHIGLQASDHRSGLFPGAAVRLVHGHDLPCLLLPYLREGRVDILIQLPCRIIGTFSWVRAFSPASARTKPRWMQ